MYSRLNEFVQPQEKSSARQRAKPTLDFKTLDAAKEKVLTGGSYHNIFKSTLENKAICIKKVIAYNSESTELVENEINILSELAKLKSDLFVDFIGFAKKQIDVSYAHYFLVMEWLPYCLKTEIKTKDPSSYTWQQRYHIMIVIIAATQFLHDLGFIHADIKSDNILLTEQHVPKLCDFGLSVKGNATDSSCGTPSHAAPEVLLGNNVTKESDIYSLSTVLWEILAWELHHQDMKDSKILHLVVTLNLRKKIPDDTPPNIAKAIQRGWDKNPENRPDAKQLLDLVCTESNENYRAFSV